MTFEETVNYIYDIPKFAGKNTLEDTRKILERLYTGGSRIIHVAGTNGKGSVCSYLKSILSEAGFSVGMFISPHLVDIRERISIDEQYISEKDFIKEFEEVARAYKEVGVAHPSFFEYLFLMGMSYFQKNRPDIIILETGLGGRLDATNSVMDKELCIITEIGFDHMQYLGNSYESIASEKAGIIRCGVPVVFIDKRKESTTIIENKAETENSQTIKVSLDNVIINQNNGKIDFVFEDESYCLNTTAIYQVENASLAITAAKKLAIDGVSIRNGITKGFWPGRMEEVAPNVFIDGAHNEDGINAFLETVKKQNFDKKNYLLFGMVNDKDYKRAIEQIGESGLFSYVALTTIESDRTLDATKCLELFEKYNDIDRQVFENTETAWNKLMTIKNDNVRVYAVGSLYMIGEIKRLLGNKI